MDEPDLDNPYPGLRPFLADETHLFFGRDEHRIELLQRLRQTRFLAVVGTSGSGKSSLVRAGLLPGILGGFMAGQGRRWRIADLHPGTDPIGNLARALDQQGVLRDQPLSEDESSFTAATLRRSGLGLVQVVDEARLPAADTLLVLVDQFEEIFRGLEAGGAIVPDDATAFVKLLLAASTQAQGRIFVVLTMRSDFLGDCARFRGLPEAINAGQYLVPRLNRDQIREAITGPAAVRGAVLAPSLVDRLLNDVGDNPDQLPILQHALMRTWDHWIRRRSAADVQIEIEDFDAIGGMREALNRHADEVLEGLSVGLPADAAARRQRIAQQLFKALVDTAPSGREVRRFAQLSELVSITGATQDELRAIVAPFREPQNAFLTPPINKPLGDKDQLDISHESLIRNWLTLQRWRLEEKASGEQYRLLADTAARRALHRVAGLWGDPDLGEALRWREVQHPNGAWALRYGGRFEDSMAFLDASHAKQIEEQAERQRGQRVRRALALGVLALAIYAVLSWAMADILLATRQAEQVKRSTGGLEFSTKLSQAAAERRSGKPAGQIAACGDVASLTDSHDRALWMRVCDPESPPVANEEALMQAHELAALLAQGRVDEVASGAGELPGYLAIQVHDVMTRLADLTTAAIRSEQRILQLRYAQARGEKPRQVRATSLARAPQSFDHPVHRSLAGKIANHEPLSSGEEWLLSGFRHSKDASKADDESETALRCVPPGMEGAEAVGSLGTDTFFQRMCLASLQPVSWLADPGRRLVQLVHDLGSDLVLLLAWPIWGLWRWRRQRAGARFDAPPSTLRRTLAAQADITLAVLAAAPFFLLGKSAMEVAGDSVIIMLSAVLLLLTAVVAFAGYLLFCDAIAFRHCRSLGKIAFGLRPVQDDGPAPRAVSLAESARRNATFTISTLVVISVLFGITVRDPLATEIPWFDVALAGTLLLAVWVPMYLLRGRTWGDRWSGTRVVDVRSALGSSVSAKPDSLPGAS